MTARGTLRWLWLIVALAVCQSVYLATHLPTIEQYEPAADEGTYFRDAVTLLDRGPSGFAALAHDFLADPALQVSPPPVRVGHLLFAAGTLAIHRSFPALSLLSIVAHALVVLVSFLFVRRWCGDVAAACAAVLVATSPLASGLARRALSDCDYGLFATLAAFACIEWAVSGRRGAGVGFVAAVMWALIVKETTFFLLPAYAVTIAVGSVRREGRVNWRHVSAVAIAPAVAILVYAVLFGGVGTMLSIVKITLQMNTFATNEYLRLYHAGPWSTYFIDALLLAPFLTLASLVLCGWYVTRRPAGEPALLLLVLIAAGILVFLVLPQNPRYSNPLDLLTRVFVGMMIPAVAASLRSIGARRVAIGAAVAFFAVADVASFHRLFVAEAIYDPTAAELLRARRIVPGPVGRPRLSANRYVDLGFAYYRAGDYQATVDVSQRAILLQPDLAAAYNNLGAAYCSLGRWQDAVAPLETALRLKPDLTIARSNLQWAESELRK